MTGVFTLEYAGTDLTVANALAAFRRANTAVGCYREMSWHRMPTRGAIEQAWEETKPAKLLRPTTDVSIGALFLPRDKRILVSDFETRIPGLYTLYSQFRDAVAGFVEEVTDERA